MNRLTLMAMEITQLIADQLRRDRAWTWPLLIATFIFLLGTLGSVQQ
ncbi:MAG: hypothetical protein HPY82_05870 [Gammaproteobacteria bacterium]|nr:hypothetical protein [Gammaproteobacteria bacterium]